MKNAITKASLGIMTFATLLQVGDLQAQDRNVRGSLQADGTFSETFHRADGSIKSELKIELVLDAGSAMDENVVGSFLGSLVKRLNIQSAKIFGTTENHFSVILPLHGVSKDRYGRNENAVSQIGVALAGAGGKKTYLLKKLANGDLRLSIDANSVLKYITSTDNRELDCNGCITNLNNSGQYSAPRSLDFAVQSNLDLAVEYNKFKMTAYYHHIVGTGKGTMDYTNSKDHGDNAGPVAVDFNNKFRASKLGLRLEYKISNRYSVFARAELNNTRYTESLRENDIDMTYISQEEVPVTYEDGSTGMALMEQENYIYQKGHSQTSIINSKNLEFGVGVKIRLGM